MYGAPGRTRTYDPLLRRQLLYPTELRVLMLCLVVKSVVLGTAGSIPSFTALVCGQCTLAVGAVT